MHLTITVDNDDTRIELEALFDWLRHEDALRGRVRLRPTAVAPGAMGTLDDVLTVALGAGGVGVVLARSLSEWLRQRTSDVRLTLTRSNGEKISLEGRRIRDPAELIETVSRFADKDATDDDATA